MGGWSPLQLRPVQLPGSLRQVAEVIRPSMLGVGLGRAVGRALDDLEWHQLEVDGRRSYYGVGGEGLPVVFLHGWGLGHRAYQRALRRLIGHGCRVYAPALPGFGGTADLPRDQRTIEGYAAWVDAFLTTVDVPEPALVLGHSFGGGVAIKLAHDHPSRVRYLVLLNSVGGPAWGPERIGVGTMGERPFWSWAVDAGRELLPSRETYDVARAVTHDFTLNVLENPWAVVEVGLLARRADLRAELAVLGQRELPVLVLWSDHDQVLPLSSFEAPRPSRPTSPGGGPRSWRPGTRPGARWCGSSLLTSSACSGRRAAGSPTTASRSRRRTRATVDGVARDVFVVRGEFEPDALAGYLSAKRVSRPLVRR